MALVYQQRSLYKVHNTCQGPSKIIEEEKHTNYDSRVERLTEGDKWIIGEYLAIDGEVSVAEAII